MSGPRGEDGAEAAARAHPSLDFPSGRCFLTLSRPRALSQPLLRPATPAPETAPFPVSRPSDHPASPPRPLRSALSMCFCDAATPLPPLFSFPRTPSFIQGTSCSDLLDASLSLSSLSPPVVRKSPLTLFLVGSVPGLSFYFIYFSHPRVLS